MNAQIDHTLLALLPTQTKRQGVECSRINDQSKEAKIRN